MSLFDVNQLNRSKKETNHFTFSVITPLGTELHDYKALNVQDDSEWSAEPKLPIIVENATQQQINQNPYIKPPKLRKS